MQNTCAIAFKEWAAVCAALGEGRQAIILRKGGIHEGRAGFRVAHSEFWLFPTYLHEAAEGLLDDARPFLERALAGRPSAETIRLTEYAVVTDVIEVTNESLLANLAGQHVWSPQTVLNRFHYRQPGLFALVVRIYRSREPLVIPDSPHFAGCRSWVELPESLSTGGLEPALDAEAFGRMRSASLDALGSS